MNKLIDRKKQEGFTIIEVLIVLAIAGLIILIVFLAVPALQRNSRNTQRKNDVSALIGAIQEHVNNSQGQLPADKAAFINNAKLGFYDPASATEVVYTKRTTPYTTTPTDTSAVTINTYSKCNGNTGLAATGATSRNVTAVYFSETSGSPTLQCQDL